MKQRTLHQQAYLSEVFNSPARCKEGGVNSPPKKAMRTINTESIILLPLDLAVVLITLTTCAVSVFAFGGMLHAGMSAPDYYSQSRLRERGCGRQGRASFVYVQSGHHSKRWS